MILIWNLDQYLNLMRETKQKNWWWCHVQNCDIIVIFPIYGHFGVIQKLYNERIFYKFYVFINSNILSYNDWKTELKSF